MILLDTSVLIDFLKGKDNAKVRLFEDILDQKIPWGICEYVFQEVLQGARDEKEFNCLREYLDSVPIFGLKYGKASFEKAALLHYQCRRASITIRSSIDVLIAEIAIEHGGYLLHNDADFDHMAGVVKALKIFH